MNKKTPAGFGSNEFQSQLSGWNITVPPAPEIPPASDARLGLPAPEAPKPASNAAPLRVYLADPQPHPHKLTYAFFAFFLGTIGAHKFYAGHVGMGFIYLLLFWTYIPAALGIIEGVVALTKQSDAEGRFVKLPAW